MSNINTYVFVNCQNKPKKTEGIFFLYVLKSCEKCHNLIPNHRIIVIRSFCN